jgi:hypothetical protein
VSSSEVHKSPGQLNFLQVPYMFSTITDIFFPHYRNVYWLTAIEQRASHNSDVHRSLQNCGFSVCNLCTYLYIYNLCKRRSASNTTEKYGMAPLSGLFPFWQHSTRAKLTCLMSWYRNLNAHVNLHNSKYKTKHSRNITTHTRTHGASTVTLACLPAVFKFGGTTVQCGPSPP